MGFYTNTGLTSLNENFLEDIQVEASTHDPGIKGAMAIIAENEMNYATIMQAVGYDELRYFEENGTEMIYESSTLKDFFGKLKEFFMKVYEKVKGLFKTFIAMLDSWIRSDSDFVKKYRQHLLQVDTKGFEYKGFVFKLDGVKVADAATATQGYLNTNGMKETNVGPHINGGEKIKEQIDIIERWRSTKEDHVEKMRGLAAGESSAKLTSKEFAEKLFTKLRGNEDKPIVIDKVDVGGLLEIISNFKDAKKKAETDFKALEKGINEIIKALNTQEKDIAKAVPGTDAADKAKTEARSAAIKFAAEVAAAQKDRLAVLQTVQGACMSALKQQNRQAKAVCVKLVSYKPQKEGFSGIGSSSLSNVTLK